MNERLIFATPVERAGTCELILCNFPIARFTHIPDEEDFISDMELAVNAPVFFRWAATTVGPARLVLFSCFNLSLALHEPPSWMAHEIRTLFGRNLLTSGL